MEGSLCRVNRAPAPAARSAAPGARARGVEPARGSPRARRRPARRGPLKLAAAWVTIRRVSTSFPLDGMRVRFAGATNIGRKRDHNEDSISVPENERLAIVADGMGGHASGEVASRLAVEIINDHLDETGKQQTLTWPYKVDRDMRKDINRMVTGIMLTNLEIWERAQREPHARTTDGGHGASFARRGPSQAAPTAWHARGDGAREDAEMVGAVPRPA